MTRTDMQILDLRLFTKLQDKFQREFYFLYRECNIVLLRNGNFMILSFLQQGILSHRLYFLDQRQSIKWFVSNA